MKENSRLLTHSWMLVVGGVALIAGHVILFTRLRHAGLSLAVISGLGVLVIAKHLGVFGSLYTLFRRRSRD